nr:hypothetical protein [Tanacetum cinerariifolium]
IKREFSNARTPQQNGVAARRNRTLIEAARTITPAIGFLKPFGCHVMILNTLDNLGKFEAKGDEGHFIGYSMSSKAFKVFNKRTRRVEENLHVKFLENKAIEKGAGPNWLFDIDSLTKSMNYVLVDAGINSTNLSGTKDAANQEVKKDVSSLRYIVLPNWAHDDLLEFSLKPKKVSDALQDPSWVEAMQKDLFQFKIQKVWTLVDCPKGVRPIGTKWVLKNKRDERGIVVRNKARLVAQGHTQEEGIDYDECTRWMSRVLFYGTIDEEVYVMQPPGFEDPAFPARLCREFEALMHEKLQMSAMGELNFFLGLQLQKEDGIFLSQDKYIGDILKKFRFLDVRSSNTPMDNENPWGKDGTEKDVELHLYRSMIGSLMYLTASRPDIMFAVCACTRHQVTPKECHLYAVKRIF